MMRNGWIFGWVLVLLVGLAAACGGAANDETAVCDFSGQTAVTVNILNEVGEQQRLVDVRYQHNDGSWQTFPEHINGQATIQGDPGSYRIRATKPGYTSQETFVTVAETAEGSCQLAAQTVTLTMPLAICPANAVTALEIDIEPASSDLVVTAVSSKSGTQTAVCTQTNAESCTHYSLPLNDVANYTLHFDGLAGIGPMFAENGVISYTLRTSQITLRQNRVERLLTATGANSLSASFSVTPDESGCPLADLRTLAAQPAPDVSASEPFPALSVEQLNGIIITDLAAPECNVPPEPYAVTYEALLPAGTPLAEAAVLFFINGEWQTASCGIENGRFLCTAVYPNPYIAQPYAYKVAAAGEEYVGTSLPFDGLCIIFD